MNTTRPGTLATKGDRATTRRAKPRPYHRATDEESKRSWFQLRVGPPDLARIDALASALGVTRSEAVRAAIEQLAKDLGLPARPNPNNGPAT